MSDRQSSVSASASPRSVPMATLAETLRSLDYDIEPPRTGDPPGRALIARRDLGDRAILFTADNGGRFRIDITWLVGEWPSRQEIAGVTMRVVDRVSRSVNVVGQADNVAQIGAVVAGLDTIVAWAGNAAVKPASSEQSVSGELPPPP